MDCPAITDERSQAHARVRTRTHPHAHVHAHTHLEVVLKGRPRQQHPVLHPQLPQLLEQLGLRFRRGQAFWSGFGAQGLDWY